MAIAEAIGAGLGAVLNMWGQSSANRTNLKIARETNQTNREINDAQLRAQLEQWQRETLYNDPAAQKQRLIAAGINPQSLVDSGKAQPLNLSSPIPAQQASPVGNVFADASQTMSNMLSAIMSSEQIKRQQTENYMLGISAADAIAKLQRDKEEQLERINASRTHTEREKKESERLIEDIRYLRGSYEDRIALNREAVENSRRQNSYLDKQITEQEHATLRLDSESIARIRSMSVDDGVKMLVGKAQAANLYSGARLNDQQARAVEQSVVEAVSLLPSKIEQGTWNSLNAKEQVIATKLRNKIEGMSAKEKSMFLEVLYRELRHKRQMDDSSIADFLRDNLGIDPSAIFYGSALQFLKK